ncbi:type IV secretion system DNA-binding domain-containing protein [Granulicella sibirica]|uniref:IncF plasmid conjugative transfer protein TraD n=1 Tax=Granulicella sibirica TaxID=2479048 RepID=A0A4Q0T1N7_9BACT|nr:type IV secretion system DNA-binding domain-containing protein [Granulicella sibirica]RXH56712.1 IncF plasmid conjugative transfer protein TraD [Granulicella sibirica]
MAEWGRKEYSKAWPSRTPVWTVMAFLLTPVFLAGLLTWQYERSWTEAERLYLTDYLKSGTRGQASATASSKYTLLEAVVGKSQRLVIDDEIERVPSVDGRPGYHLTEEGVKDRIARLTWVTGVFNDRGLHRVMSQAVYADHEAWTFYRIPVYLSLAFFVLALFVAVPKDRARRQIWKHGRRLRGPELVSTAEFNTKLGRSKAIRVHLPDGIAFVNEEASWWDKTFHKSLSRWVRVPRDREAMHFLIVGDSGTGKSATIRQLLAQIADRGEAAIVYDPAMEYLPQFYNESRGDVVLNPLDARCPFWTPGDEVPHEAEALTLAVSLFPDQGRENRFFVEAPRKIFAHLINQRPTPQELTYWMSNADEIDKRIDGTEMAAMIDRGAANQRSGVLGSLNMVADAFKLLPSERETKQRWSTVEWAKERKGWVFITSKPTMRERMRPLVSLWLDLLVLRMMNDDTARLKTWFVLDELASLQHLPQLKTAVTENRKSNNPMVLGFQGKAQVEALYGHVAEAMLSQPATRVFLKTSEPHASEWISKAIGEVEVERFRESRTKGVFPRGRESEQRDITREPLVMASEVAGLDPLHGYLKHGNLVVQMRFPYMELANRAEKFIERKMTPVVPLQPAAQPASVAVEEPVIRRKAPQSVQKKPEQKVVELNEQHPYFE